MFFEKQLFPFYQALEENWQAIKAEYLQLRDYQLQPWFQKEIYSGDWKVFGFFDWPNGHKTPGAALCPTTVSIIEEHIEGHATAGFSILKPGTIIDPHVGFAGDFLRCHLGLIIPENCAIKVNGEERTWQEGKVMVFDDTYEHSAWNKSREDRIILLLDFKKYTYYPKSFYHSKYQSLSEV